MLYKILLLFSLVFFCSSTAAAKIELSGRAFLGELEWPGQWTQLNPSPTTGFLSGAARCNDGGWLVAGAEGALGFLVVLRSYDEGGTWEQLVLTDIDWPLGFTGSTVPVSVVHCNGWIFIVGSSMATLATPDCGCTWQNPDVSVFVRYSIPSCAYTDAIISPGSYPSEVVLIPGNGNYTYASNGSVYTTVQEYAFLLESAQTSSSSVFGAVVSTANQYKFTYYCLERTSLQSLIPCGNFSSFYPRGKKFGTLQNSVPYYDSVTNTYFATSVFRESSADPLMLGTLQTKDLLPSNQTTPWQLHLFAVGDNDRPNRFARWGTVLYAEYLSVNGGKTKYFASTDNGATWSSVTLPAFPVVVDDSLAFQLGPNGLLGFATNPAQPFVFHNEGLSSPFQSTAAQDDTLLIGTSTGLYSTRILANAAPPSSTKVFFPNCSIVYLDYIDQLDSFVVVLNNAEESYSIVYLADTSLSSWSKLPASPTRMTFLILAYGNDIFIACSYGALYYLPSGGEQWQMSLQYSDVSSQSARQLCYLPASSSFFAVTYHFLLTSTDGKYFSKTSSPKIDPRCTLFCGPDSSGPLSGLYLLCSSQLSVSFDGGQIWHRCSLPKPYSPTAISISFLQVQQVVVLSGEVFDSIAERSTEMIFLSTDGTKFIPAPDIISATVQFTTFFWSETASSLLAVGISTNSVYQST